MSSGPNTTGKPKTEDYNLGRGILYFATLNTTTGLPDNGGFRDLGNAPEFNLSIEVETLEHQSSREGLKIVDKEVVISQDASVSFSLDEINDENVALFFAGEKATHTNVALAGFSSYEMVTTASGGVTLGRWYDIVNSAGERAYDIESADLALAEESGPTTLVENTDYELDLVNGRIFLLSTAVNIAAGEGMDVTLAANGTAKGVDEVQGLTQTNITGVLKFIAENPANNDKQTEYTFHQIELKADGDFALIGDEFTQMNFTGAAEKNTTLNRTMTKRTVQA